MPVWLISILVKYVAPIVIAWLGKNDHEVAADALRAVKWTVEEVKSLKTCPEYPEQHERFGG